MDPLSILGAAASALQIIDILTKSIKTLHMIGTQWQESDIALLSLTSQLCGLNAALQKIQEWIESESEEIHHQLIMDLSLAIRCCAILASKVHSEVEDLEKAPGGSLLLSAKAKFILRRKGVGELQSMIDRQTSTLTLLLTACNSKSLAKQQELLGASEIRKRMDSVQKDSASLVSLVDSNSFLSKATSYSSKLSVLFDFDEELFTSKPYRAMIRKTVKLSIRSGQSDKSHPAGVITRVFATANRGDIQTSRRYSGIDHEVLRNGKSQTKLFLLGVGAASKTTFIKQMESIYGHKTSIEEQESWRNIILDNIITALETLIEIWRSVEHFNAIARTALSEQFWNFALSAIEAKKESRIYHLPPNFAEDFKTISAAQFNLNAMGNASELFDTPANTHSQQPVMDRLPDNTSYLLNNIDRICEPSYTPTSNDILHARVRTTGIHRFVFNVPQYGACYAYDFGGERSERKKWESVPDHEDGTVLFMASMSGYDQVLTDGGNLNQMRDALNAFDSVVNGEYFKSSKIVLCFTKMGLFRQKISKVESLVKDHFSEYNGPEGDADSAKMFFTRQFAELVKNRKQRHVSCLYLDVTNIEEVRNVLDFVFEDGASVSAPHAI